MGGGRVGLVREYLVQEDFTKEATTEESTPPDKAMTMMGEGGGEEGVEEKGRRENES